MNPEHPPSTTTRPPWIVGILGLNLWVTALMLPMWYLFRLQALTAPVVLFASAPPLVLVLGLSTLARRRSAAEPLLAAIFPLSLLVPPLLEPMLVRATVWSGTGAAVVGLAFVAYLLSASWACSTYQARDVGASRAPLEIPPRRRSKLLPRLLVAFSAAASVLIIGAAHLHSVEGSGELLALLTLGSLSLWLTTTLWIIAPALRHRRPWPLTRPSRGAAVVWLLVVALALVMLLLASGD